MGELSFSENVVLFVIMVVFLLVVVEPWMSLKYLKHLYGIEFKLKDINETIKAQNARIDALRETIANDARNRCKLSDEQQKDVKM